MRLISGIFGLALLLMAGPAFAVPASYPACSKPDGSFSVFLHRFTNDLQFQRSRLTLPLVARLGDGVTTQAATELWDMKHIKELKDPLIYSDAGRRKGHISQSVDLVHKTPSIAEVWQAEDSEGDAIKLQYWFRQQRGCWDLTEFDDWGE
jgi:hypothetical protein